MRHTIPRRTVLTAGAATAVTASLPAAVARADQHRPTATFTLDAEVLDGGEQVVAVTIDASALPAIDASSLAVDTFSVHAKGTNPLTGTVAYDLDRSVTAVRLDGSDIVLTLSYAEGVTGGSTLDYIGDKSRNVRLDLEYTITQNKPIRLRNRRRVVFSSIAQGNLVDAEVDAFDAAVSGSGMNYRLFSPAADSRQKRPLIVWLHGGGEGGLPDDDYYDNESQLRANRGALGFATKEGQRVFGGAYVVAPQCTTAWMDDGPRFAPLVREIIDEVRRKHPIDPRRIHVVGCSNGGYMSMKMTTVYPTLFASSVPICGVVEARDASGVPLIPDDELTAISTPTWLVASRDDPTVDPNANTVHAHDLIPDSIMSLYDTVTWNGYRFLGHWSWIYVARNDPEHDGTRIWQWMADQR
ncbi:prolyl oligopeptidase family serine peptidase [Microlunatus soli]|uniref:Predicted peptidase n=1 Tax=Microlunatus soli TaxID=630515 RepID=A0A1H2A4M6_9ACTN|nr:PHB depolymerase family esterase [Microlunatus soli]SDT40864.1 Predicted peptidase [Microlunatus soli]